MKERPFFSLGKGCVGNRGQVSLAGALVAGAIALTSLMAVLSLLKTSAMGQRTIQSRADQTDLKATLRMILDNPTLCKKAFWDSEVINRISHPQIAYFDPDNSNLSPDKLPFSVRFGDSTVIAVGSNLDTVTWVSWLGLGEADRAARRIGAGTTTYVSILSIGLNSKQKSVYAANGSLVTAAKPDLILPLYVQTDSYTHQIVSCGTSLAATATPVPTSAPSATPVPPGPSCLRHEVPINYGSPYSSGYRVVTNQCPSDHPTLVSINVSPGCGNATQYYTTIDDSPTTTGRCYDLLLNDWVNHTLPSTPEHVLAADQYNSCAAQNRLNEWSSCQAICCKF